MSTLTRRALFGIGLGAAATGAYAAVSNWHADTYALEVNEVPIQIAGLPSAFRDYRIAFLSDIHIGTCANLDFIADVARQLSDIQPDLILHGGDFLLRLSSVLSQATLSLASFTDCSATTTDNFPEWLQTLVVMFAALAPKDGSYGVLGNHEGGLGARPCTEVLTTGGIKILRNESVLLTRGRSYLRLIGLDDYWTGIPRIPSSVGQRQKDEVRIVLAHNPDSFTALLGSSEFDFDLGLAGHTHGGQIQLPGLGGAFYNVADARFRDGLWKGQSSSGAMRSVFTTRGIGTVVLPLRVNCPPEIAIIRLEPT
jgi:predicted MPP superfamily phosphohydrolase